MGSTPEVKDNELMRAQTHVFNHLFRFISSMSLKCAVELGILDVIHNHGRPITLSRLVAALSLPPTKSDSVYRLMRLLVHSDFLTQQKIVEADQEEEGFSLTLPSRLLLKDNPNTLSSYVAVLDPAVITPFHFLSGWLQGSESTAFEATNGMPFWKFLEQNPGLSNNFNDALASDSAFLATAIINQAKELFQNLKSLVDVGGGTGTVAQAIAAAFPHLKCLVLDLPNVVGNLTGSKNLDYIAGDMFQAIPRVDAVFMKFVLHDWGDDDCIKILKRCREAIPSRKEGGKVIMVEIVMEDRKQEHESTETQLFFDILMMASAGGNERTEKEWEKLFLESGFSDYKITPILGFRSLIVVYP